MASACAQARVVGERLDNLGAAWFDESKKYSKDTVSNRISNHICNVDPDALACRYEGSYILGLQTRIEHSATPGKDISNRILSKRCDRSDQTLHRTKGNSNKYRVIGFFRYWIQRCDGARLQYVQPAICKCPFDILRGAIF